MILQVLGKDVYGHYVVSCSTLKSRKIFNLLSFLVLSGGLLAWLGMPRTLFSILLILFLYCSDS